MDKLIFKSIVFTRPVFPNSNNEKFLEKYFQNSKHLVKLEFSYHEIYSFYLLIVSMDIPEFLDSAWQYKVFADGRKTSNVFPSVKKYYHYEIF